MNFAYDWAFARPVRKVYYNLTITGLSVFVAVFIGTIELLGLLSQNARLTARSGPSWRASTSTRPASSSSGCSW
jgi:high-affinity nickel permease